MTSPGPVIYGILKGALNNPGVKVYLFRSPEIRKLRGPGYVIGFVMDGILNGVQKVARDGNRVCGDVNWIGKLWYS